MSEIVKKWRDPIIDPMQLPLKHVLIEKVISYPPAGNDVFECEGKYKNNKERFFLKIERSKISDFYNEVLMLKRIKRLLPVPIVYESGIYQERKYIIVSKIKGDKLSAILKKPNNFSKDYLYAYGQQLAEIHQLETPMSIALQREINDYPKKSKYKKFSDYENNIVKYLEENKPKIVHDTFIHGDFHYGNIIWEKKKITGIIDWEYSGKGFKEQDIAWSVILRPTQQFMNTILEIKLFLEGYSSNGNYDLQKLKWCLINGYFHFYLMNKTGNNNQYLKKLKYLIKYFMSDNNKIMIKK